MPHVKARTPILRGKVVLVRRKGAGVVLRRPVVERDGTEQTAPPDIVFAADQPGEVLQLEAILIGVGEQLGGAPADWYGGNLKTA